MLVIAVVLVVPAVPVVPLVLLIGIGITSKERSFWWEWAQLLGQK